MVENQPANAGDAKEVGSISAVGNGNPLQHSFFFFHFSILAWKIPWTEEPGRLYSPWGRKESYTTEHAHTHTQSCGNPASDKSFGTVFLVAFAHFLFLCNIYAIITVFQTFSYYGICYGD